MIKMRGVLLIFIFSVYIRCTSAFPMFQGRIPNGRRVPNPCKPGEIWRGVGHLQSAGAGPRNAFGLDFKASGFIWTEELCRKDSDGDGLSNGQELGDPDCTWTRRNRGNLLTPRSHPGFCEVFNSANCSSILANSPANPGCNTKTKSCEVIKEPGVQVLSLRMTRFEIPAEETTYMCMIHDVSLGQPHHLVALTPSRDSDLLHHIVVFGCNDNRVLPPANVRFSCGLMAPSSCSIIGGYFPGSDGQCYSDMFGFLIGGNGYRKLWVQYHYNNPEKQRGHFDSSGMDLYYTQKLRRYNAGVAAIHGQHFTIPPRQISYNVAASCTHDCTQQFLSGDIYVVLGINHMHRFGREQKTEVIRNGTVVQVLTDEKNYQYGVPSTTDHAIPVRIQQGDEIRTTCTYNTQASNTAVNWGLSTQDEMCIVFILFYPQESWQKSYCRNFRSVPICQIRATGKYNGCHFTHFLSVIERSNRFLAILRLCQASDTCSRRCRDILIRLLRHRCLQGDLRHLWRSNSKAMEIPRLSQLFSEFSKCNI